MKFSDDAKNAHHLISRSNDEYLLSECSKQVWFTIELCETIKVVRFELENHELYAGSPRELGISVATKYSTSARNWVALGNFTSTGQKKAAESFENPRGNVFGKFVRVEILSYYGEEHYCTLTSLRYSTLHYTIVHYNTL